MLQRLAEVSPKEEPFHASSSYLFQDNCVNLTSKDNISGDWIQLDQGGLAGGPSGSQLDKISTGFCSPMFILQRVLQNRTVKTAGGGTAAWDGKMYRIVS
jgi:hypothetical protein